jgi:arsenical-resistance protein 2
MSAPTQNPADAEEVPWHARLPPPKIHPKTISQNELIDLIRAKTAGKDFVVVDVRRNDFENAIVNGAINLPAQSFYQTVSTLVPILSQIPLVIFYCGSSNGRAPRCAGWYADALLKAGKEGDSQSLILEGGIKGWLSRWKDQPEYEEFCYGV